MEVGNINLQLAIFKTFIVIILKILFIRMWAALSTIYNWKYFINGKIKVIG